MSPIQSQRRNQTSLTKALSVLALLFSTGNAFQPSTTSSTRTAAPSLTTRLAKTRNYSIQPHSMTLGDVSEFYATYPLQSAVLTCGFKASVADGIAQVRSSNPLSQFNIEMRRNLAYVLYGGIFIGLMCHLEYDHLFPFLFGTEQSLKIIAEKVIFDDFISAPLMWLPPAYFIKAVIYDYPLKEGLEKYITDIKDNELLMRYWSIWVPAQTISFSVIPDHLRVAFMASVSFFWFILFSTVSSKNDDTTETDSVSD